MEKSANYIYSERLYESLGEEKKRISLEFLYNAVCCFHDLSGDKIIDMLMTLDDEEFTNLERKLRETRNTVCELQKEVCKEANLDSVFASPDMGDILFYQISNDLPIQ